MMELSPFLRASSPFKNHREIVVHDGDIGDKGQSVLTPTNRYSVPLRQGASTPYPASKDGKKLQGLDCRTFAFFGCIQFFPPCIVSFSPGLTCCIPLGVRKWEGISTYE